MSSIRYGLAVDVGNTRTALGLFRLASGKVTGFGSLPSSGIPSGELTRLIGEKLSGRRIVSAVIGSVVPRAVPLWKKVLRSFTDDILVAHHELELGIPLSYPRPETIGIDRLANAVGACQKYGAPVLVADFGTAVTFDVVTQNEGYVGGVIEPGWSLMFDCLAERTALLPKIRRARTVPRIGTSTEKAMQLGAHLGYRGMVGETFRYLAEEYGDEHLTLVATGGDHEWVVKGFDPPVISDHTLTLFGLGAMYRMNRTTL